MARATITRHVAADPASVALLLAEAGGADDRVAVTPPRRTGVGFTAGIKIADPVGPSVAGDVVIEPATDEGSVVRLAIGAPQGVAAGYAERAGAQFLSELAVRARSRSYAA